VVLPIIQYADETVTSVSFTRIARKNSNDDGVLSRIF
jgi:hypothetical protein